MTKVFALTVIVAIVFVVFIFLPLLAYHHVNKFRPYLNWDSAFHLETENGWNIALYYYGHNLADGSLPPKKEESQPKRFWFQKKIENPWSDVHEGPPVILCHGLAANHFGFDLTPQLSMALYLKRAGFPVYNLDLRGSGLSFREGAKHKRDYDFYFDDWVLDVKHIIKNVLAHYNEHHRHKAGQVYWVGHSMGAMLAYAAACVDPNLQRYLAGYVNLGGPLGVTGISQPMVKTILKTPKFLVYHLEIKKLAKLLVPIIGKIKTRFDEIFYNNELLEGDTLKRYLAYGIENIPRSLGQQLGDWLERDLMVNKKYSVVYDDKLEEFRVPSLIINGIFDHFGTSFNMQKGFDRLGAKDKKLITLSKANGFSADYCHGGLQFGRSALREVYPIIAKFIKEKNRELNLK